MELGLKVPWSQAEMLQRESSWAKPSLVWKRGAFHFRGSNSTVNEKLRTLRLGVSEGLTGR